MVVMIKEKIEAAEAIRGVACLFVVFSHLSLTFFPSLHNFFNYPTTTEYYELWMHNSPFAFWYSGTAAVYIFFVLSGYVLTYTIVNSRDPIKKIKQMSVKRYPRLMLPALVSCILLWAAYRWIDAPTDHVTDWGSSIGDVPDSTFLYALYDGSIKSFFLGYSDYNWVLWTMRIELFGSFGLFFLLYLREKKAVFSWLLPILTILLCFDLDYLGYAAFLIGSLFYFHKKNLSNISAAFCLLLGLYFAGVHNTSYAYQWFYDLLNDHTYEILNFLSGPLIVMSIMWNEKLADAFSNRVTIYLGKLSFAAYLNHILILFAVGLPMFQFLLEQHWSYAWAATVTCMVVVAVTIAFSEVFYQLVDKNTIKLSAKISDKLI